jgi:hypothetical protein
MMRPKAKALSVAGEGGILGCFGRRSHMPTGDVCLNFTDTPMTWFYRANH